MKTDVFLNRFLSASSLVGGWMCALTVKYALYGMAAFDKALVKGAESGVLDQIGFYFYQVVGAEPWVLLLVAIILDHFLWPYFYRDEVREIKLISQE